MQRAFLISIAAGSLAACSISSTTFSNGHPDATGDGKTGPDAPADAEKVPSGDYVWVRSLSQVATQNITAAASGILVPGYLTSTADLGSGSFTTAGAADQVVAAFKESDASLLYGVHHGSTGQEYGLLTNVDPNGGEIVAGVAYGSDQDFGQGVVTGGDATISTADGYIGDYQAGQASWVQRIVGPSDDKIAATMVGPDATVIAGGWFQGSATWNSSPLTSDAGTRDIFFSKLNAFTGAVALTKQISGTGGSGHEEVSGGGTNPSDLSSFVLAGIFDDTLAFGGTAAAITGNKGGVDIWIAKLDSMTGNGIWAVAFGGTGDDRNPAVALDAQGDVYVTGTFNATIAFGTTTLTSVGDADIFVAKLSGTDGTPIWAISIGSAAEDLAGKVAIDNAGHVALCAALGGALPAGKTMGGNDAIVAEYTSDTGTQVWQHVYSTANNDGAGGVVYGTSGDVLAAISLGGAFDFGTPVIGDPNPLGVLLRIAK